jgi:hypothetical protein
MASGEDDNRRTLEAAETIAGILDELGEPCALIGAAALAVYGYPRATEDLDLAVATDPFSTLAEARERILAALECDAELNTPDAEDPLGGVLTITGENFDPIQIVNFINPLSGGHNPGLDAITTSLPGLVEGSSLRVVDLPHLVALKLYAGGPKSRLDVMELLARNASMPIAEVTALCERFGLREDWERLLAEMRG